MDEENLEKNLCEYVLNSINTGVMLIGVDYLVKYANQLAKEKLGVQGDLNGRMIFGLLPSKIKEKIEGIFEQVKKTDKPVRLNSAEIKFCQSDHGNIVDLTINLWKDERGRIKGWVIFCEDTGLGRSFFNDALRVNIFVRYVVNLMSEGATVLNREGQLEYANQRFYQMLGYSPKDITNKNWTDWCYEGDLKIEGGKKQIKKEKVINGVSVYRLRLIKKDGSLLPVTMSVLKNVEEDLDIGSIGVIVDETERVKLESDFNEVTSLNKKILETISTYIFTLDVDMNIKFVNRRVEEEFGIDGQAAIGQKISEILPMFRVIEDWSSWVMRSLRPYKVDRYKISLKDDQVLFINVDIQPLYFANQLNGVVCSFDDVTLSAKLEEQIEMSFRELEITHGKLANFLKRQSDFLADVSHELRTPLTIIKGNIEVALQDENVPTEELKEVMTLVESEVSRMSVMVEDLLLLTKMDQGDLALQTSEFKIRDMMAELVTKLELYREYENRVEFDIHGDVNILADRSKLLTLIWNLVENGLKYSPADEKVRVTAKLGAEKNELKMEIIDNGIGIPEDEVKNIFDRFYRVDKARSRDRGGSGLGLAICKRIVEAHNGEIEVKSLVNTGTVFTLKLPIIKPVE